MRVDQYLDRLAGHLCNCRRDILAEACRRVEDDDAPIRHKKCGLPSVIGDDVCASSDALDCISELWIDLPELRLYRGQNRNIPLQGLRRVLGWELSRRWLRRLSHDMNAKHGERENAHELLHSKVSSWLTVCERCNCALRAWRVGSGKAVARNLPGAGDLLEDKQFLICLWAAGVGRVHLDCSG